MGACDAIVLAQRGDLPPSPDCAEVRGGVDEDGRLTIDGAAVLADAAADATARG